MPWTVAATGMCRASSLRIGGEWNVREQSVCQLLDGGGNVQWWQVCQHG